MKFKIRKIQARDLVNVGTLLDVQDPGLKIRVGKYEFNTERYLTCYGESVLHTLF